MGFTVVKNSNGQTSKPIMERGTFSYQLEMKESYYQIYTDKSLKTLISIFNERMLWAVYTGQQGDMLHDGGVNYAVCTDAANNVINGVATGYEITIGRISGNVKFNFVISHRRMQRSPIDADEVDPFNHHIDPFNHPIEAEPLAHEIVAEGGVIPPFWIADDFLYERIRVVHRVEKLTEQQWKAFRDANGGQPRNMSRRQQNRVYLVVLGHQLTNVARRANVVRAFSLEEIEALPMDVINGINIFSGLRGDNYGRQLLWHFAANVDGLDRERGYLKWFIDLLEGNHCDRWKDTNQLFLELQHYLQAYYKNCPLDDLNKVFV